ncbi:excinuclease ATPase subunit [Gilvimarinus sp. F26214L]|uniref:excinuclease ATPase subunit n=1 Tax=Gilvimarinus sp. DZF01 TaxID=3461371 RepID=UPI0040463A81
MRTIAVMLVALLAAAPAFARDSAHMLSIKDALAANDAKERLGDEVTFYFGDQGHPAVGQKMSELVANRKTNAFGKSDEEACNWVFLSSMLALRDSALQRGADAVVNIQSFYDKNAVSDNERFECHAGNVIAGVALKGTLVKFK